TCGSRTRRSLFLRGARHEERSLVIPNERRITPRRAKTVPALRVGPPRLRGKYRHAALRDLARECHCLRPAPCLAIFGAATWLATKRQQTLGTVSSLSSRNRARFPPVSPGRPSGCAGRP